MISWRQLTLVGVVVALLLALSGCGGGDDAAEDFGDGPNLTPDAALLQAESARAMGEVTSVRFMIARTGAPVFVDPAGSIVVDEITGRFSEPGSADAILAVTVNESLRTELGAVAIGDEVWLSNPVTGRFETLPPGFDLDPSSFFDPKGGWQPLVEDLQDMTFVEEQANGLYFLTGTAPAERMTAITAGLVRGQDVDLDLWLNPVTAEVVVIEFATDFGGETTDWVLELSDYGEPFDISPPEE